MNTQELARVLENRGKANSKAADDFFAGIVDKTNMTAADLETQRMGDFQTGVAWADQMTAEWFRADKIS